MLGEIRSETRKLRVLAFTRYDQLGASSRLRIYQFVRPLKEYGLDVEIQPLFRANYLSALYTTGTRQPRIVAEAYRQRLRTCIGELCADVVWLEKELVPWAPALIERGLLRKLPYVADYDDAIFHNYDLHRNPILRALFRSKIAKVMCGAAVVVAGNRYIADRARAAGAENVQVVPTVVDEAKYGLRTCYPHGDRGVTVGWIGSPATQYLLEPVLPIIESVLELPRDRFVTIGTRFGAPLFRGHEERPWSEETEVSALAELDVGVMPLRDAPFERGKCGYKIIQYMASGCAVVASPVGANCDIVVEGETGFLAETAEQWSTALRTLKNDRDMRVRMAEAGRKRFEQRYSLRSAVPIVAEILRGAASGS